MSEVVRLHTITTLDIPAVQVLEGAIVHGLDSVFVIGEKNGELYAAASTSNVGDILVLVEKFKREVI